MKRKIKSMSETMNNNGCSDNTATNWLGFSLSPHMEMKEIEHEHHHYNTSLSSTDSTSFYVSSSSSTYAANGAFHSPLSVMPLKSDDGSLSIMQGNYMCSFYPSNIKYPYRTSVCVCV